MSYSSSFEAAGAAGQISSQTSSNISFLGLRPARGGNWEKRGIQKIFLERCVGRSPGTTRSCVALSQERRALRALV